MKKTGIYLTRGDYLGNFLYDHLRENDWHWLFHAMLPSDKSEKIELLRVILFESDMLHPSQLEDLVFRFGSLLTEKDYLERELFVYLASLVHNFKLATDS